MTVPRIKDNDRDQIAAQIDGTDVQTWEYENETERRVCMRLARAFQNGWYACDVHNKGAE